MQQPKALSTTLSAPTAHIKTPQLIVSSPEEIANMENIRLDLMIKTVLFNSLRIVSNKVQTTNDQIPRLAKISKEVAL